jgi:hypothetical protein
MIRPFDPTSPELKKLDRIVGDSATGLLWLVTAAVVCTVFLAMHAVTGIPKFLLRSGAHLVHDFERPV